MINWADPRTQAYARFLNENSVTPEMAATPAYKAASKQLLNWFGVKEPEENPGGLKFPSTQQTPGLFGNQTLGVPGAQNPKIRTAISGILGQAVPGGNQVSRTVKNQAQQTRIDATGKAVDANQAQADESLAEFTKQRLANRAGTQANVAQENEALGRFYDTGPKGVQSQLTRLARAQQAAIRAQAQQAMNNARRGNSMRRMQSGDSSYNDALYADTAGRIGAEAALRGTELDRENLLYTLGAQQNLGGKRNALIDDMLRRELASSDAYNAAGRNRVGLTGSLLNLDEANSETEVLSPEEQIMRRLGLISGLEDLDRAGLAYNDTPRGWGYLR